MSTGIEIRLHRSANYRAGSYPVNTHDSRSGSSSGLFTLRRDWKTKLDEHERDKTCWAVSLLKTSTVILIISLGSSPICQNNIISFNFLLAMHSAEFKCHHKLWLTECILHLIIFNIRYTSLYWKQRLRNQGMPSGSWVSWMCSHMHSEFTKEVEDSCSGIMSSVSEPFSKDKKKKQKPLPKYANLSQALAQ